jgi:hypothetical protein
MRLIFTIGILVVATAIGMTWSAARSRSGPPSATPNPLSEQASRVFAKLWNSLHGPGGLRFSTVERLGGWSKRWAEQASRDAGEHDRRWHNERHLHRMRRLVALIEQRTQHLDPDIHRLPLAAARYFVAEAACRIGAGDRATLLAAAREGLEATRQRRRRDEPLTPEFIIQHLAWHRRLVHAGAALDLADAASRMRSEFFRAGSLPVWAVSAQLAVLDQAIAEARRDSRSEAAAGLWRGFELRAPLAPFPPEQIEHMAEASRTWAFELAREQGRSSPTSATFHDHLQRLRQLRAWLPSSQDAEARAEAEAVLNYYRGEAVLEIGRALGNSGR